MGIKGLTKLLSDNAPKAMKQQKFESYFGRKITIDRVTNSIERIKAANDKFILGRLESFFKPVSTSTSTSNPNFLQFRHMSYSATLFVPFSWVNHSSISLNFLKENRRGYAKGRRRPNDDDDDDDDEEELQEDDKKAMQIVNIGPTIKADALSQMEAAIDALSRELLKLRTGRASSGMLDHIIVESGGVKNPLNRMAVVSVIDPKTLSITPFDPNTIKGLEKAIVSSPLGLNPKSDNQRLIASIPPLTKEHMQAVCKLVAKSSEDAKQRIRRARQKAFDTIKKALPKKTTEDTTKKGKDKAASHSNRKDKKDKDKTVPSFSVDDAKRLEKEIDEFTKKFIKSAEDMCKAKEKEITTS